MNTIERLWSSRISGHSSYTHYLNSNVYLLKNCVALVYFHSVLYIYRLLKEFCILFCTIELEIQSTRIVHCIATKKIFQSLKMSLMCISNIYLYARKNSLIVHYTFIDQSLYVMHQHSGHCLLSEE